MITLTLLKMVLVRISGEELIHKNSVLEGISGEDASIRSLFNTERKDSSHRITRQLNILDFTYVYTQAKPTNQDNKQLNANDDS